MINDIVWCVNEMEDKNEKLKKKKNEMILKKKNRY